jgi:hypothetical protein
VTGTIERRHAADGVWGIAILSPCGLYRYRLQRCWDDDAPVLVFLMLNPSTADEVATDATMRVCLRRAMGEGFGMLRVLNLFALRATDPAALRTADDPVGPRNDAAIRDGLADLRHPGDRIVCAWGNAGGLHGRGAQVERRLREAGHDLHHLGLTAGGAPRHPLYVPLRQTWQSWRAV